MARQQARTWVCGLVLVGWAAIGSAAAAAESFEGTVRQISLSMPVRALQPIVSKVTPEEVFAISDDRMAEAARDPASGARVLETIIKIDGKKFRVDMVVNGKPGFMLVDSAADTTSIVVPEDKVYVQWTAADRSAAAKKQASQSKAADMLREQAEKLPAEERERLKAALGEKATQPTPAALAQIEQLEKIAKVNGAYSARYALRDADQVSYAWLTQQYPELLAAFRAASAGQQAMRVAPPTPIERFAEAGLPMRVQTLLADRYEQIDLVEIKAETIADTDMQVPDGFTKVDPNAKPAAAAPAAAQPAATAPAATPAQ